MTHTRGAHVPFDFLAAEVAAAPLSGLAMPLGVTELRPRLEASMSTAALWRATEADLLRRFRGFSVDEVIAYRDAVWFPGARDPKSNGDRVSVVPLDRYVRRLACQLLEVDGASIRPRVPQWGYPSPERTGGAGPAARAARRTWRWMTFAMPWDLLAAALPGRLPAALQITWLSAHVDRWLCDEAFAEVHCHLGATPDFGAMWVWALRATSERSSESGMFRSPGAEERDGDTLATWIVAGALARILVADFLRLRAGRPADFTFEHYMTDGTSLDNSLLAESEDRVVLRRSIDALRLGEPEIRNDHAELGAAYRGLAGRLGDTFREPWGRWATRGESADPMAPLLPVQSDASGSSEVRWTRAGLHYLGYGLRGRDDLLGPEERPHDPMFAQVFWQAVRGRVAFYRHLVQRPMTPGLQWFLRTFARISPARRNVPRAALARVALERAGAGSGLKSFEVRIAPEERLDQMRAAIAQVWEGLRGPFGAQDEPALLAGRNTQCERERRACAAPECGVVLHFTKRRGGGMDHGHPAAHGLDSEADPRRNPNSYRFGSYFQAQSRQARIVGAMFRRWPATLQFVRGLDVCTDEAGIPTWVIAPLYKMVRDAASAVATEASRAGRELPQLRATAHAGEDFVHVLSGLRRIDEALVHLCNREGDRIGHAVALGIAADRWAERTRHVMMTREERLLDLVWEWQFYEEGWAEPAGDRGRRIEEEIRKLAAEIFRPPGHLAVREVREILSGLFRPGELFEACGFPGDRWRPGGEERPTLGQVGSGASSTSSPAFLDGERSRGGAGLRDLLIDYLTRPTLFERGTVLIGVDLAEEARALDVLQRALRRKVALQGIAVEINPTSNLLIGDLSDLANHPLWRLRPPTGALEGPAIDVCIGSDDPLTFATTLRDEYQLVLDTLERSGVPSHDARTWLEDARTAGLVYRFTRPEWTGDPFEEGFPAPW